MSDGSDGGYRRFRPAPEVVAEAERLAESSWSVEAAARLEALLWVLGEADEDHLTGAVDENRLRSLTGSNYVRDDADLSRLLPSSAEAQDDE